MRITSLKVYEGNNIKRQKKLIKVSLVETSYKERIQFLKNYFKISHLIGFKERLISIDKTNETLELWVSYTQEEVSEFILKNLAYGYESIHKLSKIAEGLIKKGLLSKIVQIGTDKLPIIELNSGAFQFGYGENSFIIAKEYQSYESNDTVLLSRDLKYLWQHLSYYHIPKAKGKIIYSSQEIDYHQLIDFPINIRSLDKTLGVSICTNNLSEFNEVFDNMIKIYSSVFIYSGLITYRVICYKGKCGLVYIKNGEFKSSEITDELKAFCKRVYLRFPIEFLYIDIEVEEIFKVVDLGCVFDMDIEKNNLQEVAEYFINCIIKDGIGIIPIVSITGTNGKTTTARLIYIILNKLGYNTGLTSTGGIFIGNEKIVSGDTTGFLSARDVLLNKNVQVGVFETARGGIYRNGLGYEKAKVAIITSLSEDHIGMEGVSYLEDLTNIKSVVLEELASNGKIIIKAQKELVQIALKNESIDNICLIALNRNIYIDEHIKAGGEALYLDRKYIIYCNKHREEKLLNVIDVPFTHEGYSGSNIQNIMAAFSAVLSIEENKDKIIEAICGIECDLYNNPGRQNIIDFGNYKLILDYGHNAEAFNEIFGIAESMKHSGITSIIAAPGDRMDKYIVELGYIAGEHSNSIIIREQQDLRGRKQGEVADLIKRGVMQSNFNKNIEVIYREEEAIIKAMENAKQGEVIILFTQCLNVIIPIINNYRILKGLEPIGKDIDFSH